MRYIDAGFMHGLDDSERAIVKCDGCGALINSGGLSREKHNQFHEALADLFDTLDSLIESK